MEYHPHQFVYMVEQGEIETLMKSKSLYQCLSCFACVERCPRNVEPAKLVEAVRLVVIRQQGMNHMTADDIPALLDDDMPQQAIVSALRKYSEVKGEADPCRELVCLSAGAAAISPEP